MEREHDIVPALYDKITRDFHKAIDASRDIQTFLRKMEDGKATPEDVAIYAEKVGVCASEALTGNLTEDVLPNGKLYYNIASRTILPLLQEVHVMITDMASTVQRQEDKRLNINLKPVVPEFPEDRVHDLINKLIDTLDEVES